MSNAFCTWEDLSKTCKNRLQTQLYSSRVIYSNSLQMMFYLYIRTKLKLSRNMLNKLSYLDPTNREDSQIDWLIDWLIDYVFHPSIKKFFTHMETSSSASVDECNLRIKKHWEFFTLTRGLMLSFIHSMYEGYERQLCVGDCC